jgi:hypothetical protein
MRDARSPIRVALLLVLAVPLAVRGQGANAPIDLTPLPGIDEELFLVRALETTYDRWPRDVTDRQVLRDWVVRGRELATRLRATIRARELDPGVARMYDDCLGLIDAYEAYLVNLGAIDRDSLRQADGDAQKAASTALGLGYRAGVATSQRGNTDRDSVAVGLVAGIIGGAFDKYQRDQARNEQQRQAIEAEGRKLDATWTRVRAEAEALASQVAARRGWKAGEAGFDGYRSQGMGDYLGRRPRDPFLRAANARIREAGESPEAVLEDARTCVACARMVPAGPVYDAYRAEFLASAAELATQACNRQLVGSAYKNGPTPGTPEAVRICRALLSIAPADPDGVGNYNLAKALGCAGQYAEAVETSWRAKPFHNDPTFAYNFACLLSLDGQSKAAHDWLEYALRQGFSDVAHARIDADLERLRAERSEDFANLTQVRFTWSIGWGIIGPDQVVVRNESIFPLTAVRLTAHVTSSGYPGWDNTMACNYVPAGGSFTWNFGGKGITSRGSDYKATATLQCAQN